MRVGGGAYLDINYNFFALQFIASTNMLWLFYLKYPLSFSAILAEEISIQILNSIYIWNPLLGVNSVLSDVIQFFLYKYPGLWNFVMAAVGH